MVETDRLKRQYSRNRLLTWGKDMACYYTISTQYDAEGYILCFQKEIGNYRAQGNHIIPLLNFWHIIMCLMYVQQSCDAMYFSVHLSDLL